jgi:pSer/pThr/pTyr-binding forkhead associated (FHA) protein
MPFCTQCGHNNADDARFCSNCGAALEPAATTPPPTPSPGQTSTITIQGVDLAAETAEKGEGLSAADQAAVDALPPGSALLVVRRGPNSGSRFLLDSDVTTAGRHPASDIFLDDVTVSRRHAEFVRAGEGFSVRDVGSLNGSYINRKRIDEAALSGGDEVQIGKYRLVYYPSLHGTPAGSAGGEQG